MTYAAVNPGSTLSALAALFAACCGITVDSNDISITTGAPLVDTLRADHDVLVWETVLHVCWVYPNTVAADFSCVVRSVHSFDADAGCAWSPAMLSHETWVYPSNAAASCWFSSAVAPVQAVGMWIVNSEGTS